MKAVYHGGKSDDMSKLFIARVPSNATDADARYFEVCNEVGSVVDTFLSRSEAESYVAYEHFAQPAAAQEQGS